MSSKEFLCRECGKNLIGQWWYAAVDGGRCNQCQLKFYSEFGLKHCNCCGCAVFSSIEQDEMKCNSCYQNKLTIRLFQGESL